MSSKHKLTTYVWALALVCAGCGDYGRCLKSHQQHVPLIMLPILVGKIIVPVFYPAHDETVCDQWEYPKGDKPR
jgi:hypothetical protein